MANKIWDGDTSTAWATGGNWVGGSAPGASGDSAYFDQTAVTYGPAGSDQSATTLDNLVIEQTFTFTFGDNGTPLKVKATIVDIGELGGDGIDSGGSGRINLDLSTAATTITVKRSGTATDTGKEPIRIKAVNASNVLHLLGGRVGIATDANGDVATFATINVTGPDAVLNGSSGLTLTTLNLTDGEANINNAVTTVSMDGGNLLTQGDYTITTLNLSAPNCVMNHRKSSGASITTANLYDGAVLDLSENAASFTITTLNVYGDCTIIRNAANPNHLVITNAIGFNRGTLTLVG